MQHKPRELLHKLLCWQSRGEEDIRLCRVDTTKKEKKKKEQRGGGIFEDIIVAEARKPELEGRLPEGSKGGRKPQAGTALQPWVRTGKSSGHTAPHWSLSTWRRNTMPCTPASKGPTKPSLHCSVWRAAAVATSISSFPRPKQDLPVAAAVSSAWFMNVRSTYI